MLLRRSRLLALILCESLRQQDALPLRLSPSRPEGAAAWT